MRPCAELQHVFLRAEMQATRRARFDARGLEPDGDPIDAQRALGHLARRSRESRNVERATRLAVLAADALVRIHVYDSVLVLDDRARRRAGFQAPGLIAVHALVLAHQPHEPAVEVPLVESDEIPVLGVEGRESLVACRPVRVATGAGRSIPGRPPRTPCSRCTSTCRCTSTPSARCAGPTGFPTPRRKSGGFRGVCATISDPLDFHEERLVFGRPGVGVHRRGRQEIGEGPVCPVVPRRIPSAAESRSTSAACRRPGAGADAW